MPAYFARFQPLAEILQNGKEYDLSSAGRGFHQTLLLLGYIYTHPGGVILLDEPDAHLEIVRQRDTFSLLRAVAREQDSQLIIASHSEVFMGEAAQKGSIISVLSGRTELLIGKQEIDQHKKLLTSIGWDKVHLAKTHGYVIFLEGSTDIDMLAAFAQVLYSPATAEQIRRANVEIIGTNVPQKAKDIFYGLRPVVDGLRGYALFDRLSEERLKDRELKIECWDRREIENYLRLPDVLRRYAESRAKAAAGDQPLLAGKEGEQIMEAMEQAIGRNTAPRALEDREDDFWRNEKMSDYVGAVFEEFSKSGLVHHSLWHADLHILVGYMRPEEIAAEVGEKLERILAVIGESGDRMQA